MNNGADGRKGPLDDHPSLEETSRKSIHWDEGIYPCQMLSHGRTRNSITQTCSFMLMADQQEQNQS